MPSAYDTWLIQSGSTIEKYEYEKPVILYDDIDQIIRTIYYKHPGRKLSASDSNKVKNREVVLNRARKEVRRLINANVNRYEDENGNNYKPVFLTLTFADNLKEISLANKEFRKFIKRLGYHIAHNQTYLKYVAVPEFQKRGAVHYHLIIFNLPYTKNKVLGSIWDNGFIKINAIEGVNNIGAYVCKYMTKDYDTKDKLAGQKCYSRSQNLHEPKELKLLSIYPIYDDLLQELEWMSSNKYTLEHESEHYGHITYTQYYCESFEL